MAGAAELWSALRPDERGLVVAVVQAATGGRVLMVGYMNEAALAATLSTRRVTFWSRSRATLWEKGETSGHHLDLVELRIDCDNDALLVRANPAGPTCHTGRPTCFFQPVDLDLPRLGTVDHGAPDGLGGALERVFATIEERKAGRGATSVDGRSYVRSLLEGPAGAVGDKLREEADELAVALASESDVRVASEAADLVFHALVALASRGLGPAVVEAELVRRHGRSGIDEKAGRLAPR